MISTYLNTPTVRLVFDCFKQRYRIAMGRSFAVARLRIIEETGFANSRLR